MRIRYWALRSPVVVDGEPLCRCGYDRDDGRHERLANCPGCPSPEEHHRYRAASWLDRRLGADDWRLRW